MIDVTYDVRTDAGGKDPDSHSRTLRRYHRKLWSKPLPDGRPFDLDERLHHRSELGAFWLASDAITHTYANWQRPLRLVSARDAMPAGRVTAFYDAGCTVGAYTVFPSLVKVGEKWARSINQSWGMHPRIRDRFDLTLECIRRLYAGQESPLSRAFLPYVDFFEIFGDFGGYVAHFLLQDLVTAGGDVRFFTDFADFTGDALPAASAQQYATYMDRSMAFIAARNARKQASAVQTFTGSSRSTRMGWASMPAGAG
ncbi:MAG: hypothetical protein KDB28_15020, partial [Tetrasphaera sp.]|nr:hypothetical protein [Tetrasphaera sp.]